MIDQNQNKLDQRKKMPRPTEDRKDLTDETKLQWLRLLRSENIGPITFSHLITRFGHAEEALKRLPEIARRAGRTSPLTIPSPQTIDEEFASYQKIGARLIAFPEPAYPPFLREIPDAPPLISVLGRTELLQKPSISIVGSRNASAIGRQLAESFAKNLGLSTEKFVITSGLARGIDTHAHKGALSKGTIAVLASGIDHVYPLENKGLHQSIAQEGLLISEMAIGTLPQSSFFPRRNRIISGLSWGLLVVEAALKSGSLLTAKCAAEQGREVFAIPGNPMDPRSRGTNQLIKQGAHLTQTIEDILQEYQPSPAHEIWEEDEEYVPSRPIEQKDVDEVREVLQHYLSITPICVDKLAQFSGLPIVAVRAALVEIEIMGSLDRHPGGMVSLRPSEDLGASG